MAKSIRQEIHFKNPDFVSELEDKGMSPAAAKKVSEKSEFGEYFIFELQFDAASGQVLGCRQVNAK